MEPFTSGAAAVAAEAAAEGAAMQEAALHAIELSSAAAEKSAVADVTLNEKTIHTLNELLDQDKYKKLAEFRELSQTDPEAARALSGDIHVKGQMGEAIMEAQLSPAGEVKSQVPVELDGAPSSNVVDLQLTESKMNLKQTELTVEDGGIVSTDNYDVMKGESASFEVKNGGMPYLRQELAAGELQQQIAAGKSISDHSFVVINEDTARAIMANPEAGFKIIQAIQDAGGKLIVGLPDQAVQSAIFLS
ncbi:hypothetical protein [Paenibacillus thermotolerans]|uniref:hypothetical protein n=1 Tax=Paenibacillus thermotolerans TaxID=3027807 RepID=UPI002367FB79|nr:MULTISPECIES: hypothetical protein [unclassified Paenibacillus]